MPIVYKYYRPERIDILERGIIMLSRPSVFNDPFELKPHYDTIQDLVLPVSPKASEQARAQIAEMQRRINEQVMPQSAIDTVRSTAPFAHPPACRTLRTTPRRTGSATTEA